MRLAIGKQCSFLLKEYSRPLFARVIYNKESYPTVDLKRNCSSGEKLVDVSVNEKTGLIYLFLLLLSMLLISRSMDLYCFLLFDC